MNKNIMTISLTVFALCIAPVWAEEKEIPMEELPAVVLSAAKTACPDGMIKEASKETDDGVTAYEVEMMVGKLGCDLKISAEGTLLEKEQQIAVKDLPRKVAGTLKKFTDIDVKKAELVQEKDQDAFYELNVEINEQAFELKINKAGKILEIESKGKKHDDDDEHEGDDDDAEHGEHEGHSEHGEHKGHDHN